MGNKIHKVNPLVFSYEAVTLLANYFRHFKKTQNEEVATKYIKSLELLFVWGKTSYLIFLTTAGSEILCIWGFCFVLKQVQKEEMKQNEIFPR